MKSVQHKYEGNTFLIVYKYKRKRNSKETGEKNK